MIDTMNWWFSLFFYHFFSQRQRTENPLPLMIDTMNWWFSLFFYYYFSLNNKELKIYYLS
jgi:hypothetical protein